MPQSSRARADLANARLIAGFAGPVALAIGLAILVNRSLLPRLADEISRDIALIFVSGVLLLVAGIAIVRVHNVWQAEWPVLVTVIGWLCIAGGLARMFAFDQLARIARDVVQLPNLPLAAGLLLAALGAFLSYKAFSAAP